MKRKKLMIVTSRGQAFLVRKSGGKLVSSVMRRVTANPKSGEYTLDEETGLFGFSPEDTARRVVERRDNGKVS